MQKRAKKLTAPRGVRLAAILLCAAPIFWVLFLYFCRPVVALHYAEDAQADLLVFFNDNHDTTRFLLAPGQSVSSPTAMFPVSDMWMLISTPRERGDTLEITKPFSRIDVYFATGGKIDRTEIRHGFFARFLEPGG